MKASRQIVPFLLLTTFVLVAFNYSIFMWMASSQKSGFRQDLLNTSLNNLESKTFQTKALYKDTKNIEWCEDNKELSINGEMYEVISVQHEHDNTIVYMIKDTEENALFSNYFSKQKKNQDLLINIIKLLSGLDHPGHHISLQANNLHLSLQFAFPAMSALTPGHSSCIIKPPLA